MNREQFMLHVDSIAYGGKGVGRRDDGKVVFVPLVIPGEQVRVSVLREHKGYVEAHAQDILEPSPWRAAPLCPYFTECGGCDWQHIAYSHQVFLKQEIVKEQLAGKRITACNIEEPVPSSNEHGYRCHATVRCTNTAGFELGFFRKQSNTVVPVNRCLVLNRRIQDIVDQVRDMLRRDSLDALDALEFHAPAQDVLVRAFLRGTARRGVMERLYYIHQGLGSTGLSCVFLGGKGKEYILGESSCLYSMNIHGHDMTFASGLGGFIQANLEVNRKLIEEVIKKASGSRTILDLYSGSGNFGIPLSMHAERVIAVEQDELLVKTGRALARKNDSPGIRFIQEDAVQAVKRIQRDGSHFDAVALDPPREGAREVVQLLCSMDISRIIYISCNPSTLVRDLGILMQGGFSVKSVRIFDMFPQTYHIESVTVLDRSRS